MDEKGEVVVTLNEHGECVLVSRQNDEHEILSIIWAKPGATESTILPPPEGGPKDRLARIERACLIRNEVKAPEWAEKWSRTYDGRTIWVGVDIDESSAREVKRTAGAPDLRPSDSDPITLPIIDAPPTPEQTESELEQRNQALRARYGLAPPVYREGPEQAHGDALAALERTRERFLQERNPIHSEVREQDLNVIEKALTTSGVPYVPELIKKLPDEWRADSEELERVAESQIGIANRTWWNAKADAARLRALELERALATAPTESDDSDIRTDHGIPS